MSAIQEIYTTSDKFKPKNEYLLIKSAQLKSEEITESGLIIPLKNTSVLDRPSFGTIVSLGKDLLETYNVGDDVVFPSTDGLDLKFDDGQYTLLREKSIIGTISKES